VNEPSSSRGLALVLVATLATLAAGWVLKSPCLGSWADGRQYNRLCYSDIAALYGDASRDRGLADDRVPYVDGENEYPVLTGLAMWVAAVPADSYPSFFNLNAVLLAGAALATAALLHRLSGRRALFFALAPTLLIYAFVNWDLYAVALATAATAAFLSRRDGLAGVLIGLGATTKLYPALLVIPFALSRMREDRRDRAALLALTAGSAWALVNIPFALASFERWSEFFRFNSIRPADWDSLWYIASRHMEFVWEAAAVNGLALATFVLAAVGLWVAFGRRLPASRVWTFGFPLLILFLLTSKVYSPQYGLWLLPWFALALPDLRWFVAFQLADVAVFVTRFLFFARLQGVGEGVPQGAFDVAVIIRAVILVGCVIAWARRSRAPDVTEPLPAMAAAA
jgi:uncharacterized membrane protein